MKLQPFVGKIVQVQFKSGSTWTVCTVGDAGLQPFMVGRKTPEGQLLESPVYFPFIVGEVVPVGDTAYGVKMKDEASQKSGSWNGKMLVVCPEEDTIDCVTFAADTPMISL